MLWCEPSCICVSLWQLFKKHQHGYWTGNEKSSQLPVDFYVLHSFLQQEIIKKKYKLWNSRLPLILVFVILLLFCFCCFTLLILDYRVFSFMTNKMEKTRTHSENRNMCKRQLQLLFITVMETFLKRLSPTIQRPLFLTKRHHPWELGFEQRWTRPWHSWRLSCKSTMPWTGPVPGQWLAWALTGQNFIEMQWWD